ncbi:MAG: alkaline phosphatase family protein [Candidatus Aminicenantia bacterium]
MMENKVEDIREKLKSLGYLEWRISGFFVKGETGLFLLSLKISIIGAIILGTGFTFLFLLTNLSLVSNFFDILLLFLYIFMSIFLLLSLFFIIFAFLIKYPLNVLKLSKRPPDNFFNLLIIYFSLLITGYLFFWFKEQLSLSPFYFVFILIPLSFLFIIFFRVFLISIFLLLGVSFNRVLPSKKAILFISILIFIIFSSFLFLRKLENGKEAEFTPEKRDIKIAIIGVDGLDISFAESKIEKGELPFIKELLNDGFVCKYPTKQPRIPAVFWTTVATGLSPEKHNIKAFQSTSFTGIETPIQFKKDPSGILWVLNTLFLNAKIAQIEPISSFLRNSKTLWEIFSEKGYKIGQLNWWASWPADEVRDFSITDRAYEKLKGKMELEMDFYPYHIKNDLFLSFDSSDFFQPDSFVSNALKRLLDRYTPELLMVYLPGLDIQWEKYFGRQIDDLKNLKNSISEIEKRFVQEDSILREISNSLKGYCKIFVFDPGRNFRNKGIRKGGEGLIIFQGYPFKKGYIFEPNAPERIAPTVLFISGFPISEDMKDPLIELMNEDFRGSCNLKIVKTFGKKKEKKVSSKFNKELLENLRSLGYIE